jgi:hypothetical protein
VYPGYRERLPFRFTGRIECIELQLGATAERTTEELVERHLSDY